MTPPAACRPTDVAAVRRRSPRPRRPWSSRSAGPMRASYNDLQDNTQPVVVFSTKDLSLGNDTDQVTCKTIDQKNSVYQFTCSGLRFYRYDRGRYFLVTNGFTLGNSRIVILAESPDIRIEFVTRNGLNNETPTASPQS